MMEKRERKTTKESTAKKEVDFVPHTPPVVKSKNIAGPPVYYPPGSGEFSRKEESMAAMSKASVSTVLSHLNCSFLVSSLFFINFFVVNYRVDGLRRELPGNTEHPPGAKRG